MGCRGQLQSHPESGEGCVWRAVGVARAERPEEGCPVLGSRVQGRPQGHTRTGLRGMRPLTHTAGAPGAASGTGAPREGVALLPTAQDRGRVGTVRSPRKHLPGVPCRHRPGWSGCWGFPEPTAGAVPSQGTLGTPASAGVQEGPQHQGDGAGGAPSPFGEHQCTRPQPDPLHPDLCRPQWREWPGGPQRGALAPRACPASLSLEQAEALPCALRLRPPGRSLVTGAGSPWLLPPLRPAAPPPPCPAFLRVLPAVSPCLCLLLADTPGSPPPRDALLALPNSPAPSPHLVGECCVAWASPIPDQTEWDRMRNGDPQAIWRRWGSWGPPPPPPLEGPAAHPRHTPPPEDQVSPTQQDLYL